MCLTGSVKNDKKEKKNLKSHLDYDNDLYCRSEAGRWEGDGVETAVFEWSIRDGSRLEFPLVHKMAEKREEVVLPDVEGLGALFSFDLIDGFWEFDLSEDIGMLRAKKKACNVHPSELWRNDRRSLAGFLALVAALRLTEQSLLRKLLRSSDQEIKSTQSCRFLVHTYNVVHFSLRARNINKKNNTTRRNDQMQCQT